MNEKRMMVSDPEICSGAPTLSGTRMDCASLVYLIRNHGSEHITRLYGYLTHDDLATVVDYCSARQCVERSGRVTFCHGCTLDKRPYDELDEPPMDVWEIARGLDLRRTQPNARES